MAWGPSQQLEACGWYDMLIWWFHEANVKKTTIFWLIQHKLSALPRQADRQICLRTERNHQAVRPALRVRHIKANTSTILSTTSSGRIIPRPILPVSGFCFIKRDEWNPSRTRQTSDKRWWPMCVTQQLLSFFDFHVSYKLVEIFRVQISSTSWFLMKRLISSLTYCMFNRS